MSISLGKWEEQLLNELKSPLGERFRSLVVMKYIIFVSVLSGMFFVIYQKSNKKGFRRWRTSFKAAAIIAASLAGLVSESAEAQEFNLYENTDQQVILVGRDSSGTPSPSNIGRQGQSPSNFPTSPSGGRPITGINPYRHLHVNPGTAGNPGGAGNGGAANYNDESGIPKIPQELKTYDYVKKKESAEECELDEQNKGGIDELPNSSEFFYKLETKTARKALKKVWKNPEAKKEVLAGLDKMNKGELLPRNQKNFKGFKTLKEIKLTDTRMLVEPGQNGGPDQIVAIFMRRDLDNIASIFKGKYK